MRNYLRWILGLAVCVGPIAELAWDFYRNGGENFEITTRHYVVTSLLLFSGWAIIGDRAWAKRVAFMIVLSITFGHVFLLSFSKKFSLVELLPGIFANLAIAFYLYRDEYVKSMFIMGPEPQPKPAPAPKPVVAEQKSVVVPTLVEHDSMSIVPFGADPLAKKSDKFPAFPSQQTVTPPAGSNFPGQGWPPKVSDNANLPNVPVPVSGAVTSVGAKPGANGGFVVSETKVPYSELESNIHGAPTNESVSKPYEMTEQTVTSTEHQVSIVGRPPEDSAPGPLTAAMRALDTTLAGKADGTAQAPPTEMGEGKRPAHVKMKVHRRVRFAHLGLQGWIEKVDKDGIWIKWDQPPASDFRSDKEIVFTSGQKKISLVFSHHQGQSSRLVYRSAWVEESPKVA